MGVYERLFWGVFEAGQDQPTVKDEVLARAEKRKAQLEAKTGRPHELRQVSMGWYFRFRNSEGRLIRESLTKYGVRTEAQAEKLWREFERKKLRKRLGMLDPTKIKLGDFRDWYLAERKKDNLSPNTRTQDAKSLGSLISVLGSGFLLRNLQQRHIREWSSKLLGQGRSPFTVRSYLSHIKAAVNFAVEEGKLKQAPKFKRFKTPERLPLALAPEEMIKILDGEKNPERRALWEFMVWTGMRRQEACDLTWKDIHLGSNAPWCRVVGKGDKERLIPLLPLAVEALEVFGVRDVGPVFVFMQAQKAGKPRPTPEALAELQAKHSNVQLGKMFGVSDVTIAKWAAMPVRPRQVQPGTISKWLKQAARDAGFEKPKLHSLRHSAGTWMAARGVPEHVIQEILGHASITTTQIYTKGMAKIANLYELMKTGLVSQT